ncbi:MAG TPA: DUF1990 domain-containing protein [Vicinamibacterales bacterium]|nr:DUF1990 domain-containing protein [Vicinamibacterales bacterium]
MTNLMFFTSRPSPHTIERFVASSQGLPLSYQPVGILSAAPDGLDKDEAIVAIGRGPADFERAQNALKAWKQFDLGWVQLYPRQASSDVGTSVAVLIRHLGFWSLNGCRVVYGVGGDQTEGSRFGIAYGTLTNHAEAGEELFEVFMNPATDEVFYRILAVSWPQLLLTRLGYPIVRHLQARFRRDSAEAMKLAVHD